MLNLSFLFLFVISTATSKEIANLYNGGNYCYPSGIPDNVQHANPNTVIKVCCSLMNDNNTQQGVPLFQWQLPYKHYIDIHEGQPKKAIVNGFTSTVFYYARFTGINVTLEFKAKPLYDNLLIACGNGLDAKDFCQLKIKTIPGSITNLDTNSYRTYESVYLQWNPPNDNGGDILNYIITVTPTPSHDSTTSNECMCIDGTCITSTTSCNVTGLMYSVKYTFTVLANNSVGTSSNSVSQDVTIYAKVPPPVNQVHVCMDFLSGSTSLTVHWTPCPGVIDDTSLTPPITNYSINISSGIGYEWYSSCERYNKSVSEGSHYNVSVSVNNEIGSSLPVTSLIFDTTWLTVKYETPSNIVYTTAQCVKGDDFVISVTTEIYITSSSSVIAPSTPTSSGFPYIPNIVSTISLQRPNFATVLFKFQVYKSNNPVMNSPIVIVTADVPSNDTLCLSGMFYTTFIVMMMFWIIAVLVYYVWIKPYHNKVRTSINNNEKIFEFSK